MTLGKASTYYVRVRNYVLVPLILGVVTTLLTASVTPLNSPYGHGWPVNWNTPIWTMPPVWNQFNPVGFVVDVVFFYVCFCLAIYFVKRFF